MYCTRCGLELREADRFCSRCGARTPVAGPAPPSMPLMLDKRNRKIAGVCAGFARSLEMDVTLIRVIWLVVALGTGAGFLAYLVAWIIMPSDHGTDWGPSLYRAPEAG
jgi:phage shock protein C